MTTPRVAIMAGGRTPFVKSGKAFNDLEPLVLAKHAVVRLLETHHVAPSLIEAIVFGAVVAEPGKPNLAREIVFEAGLPSHIEAQTISSYCITGLRTVTAVAEAIATGRIEVGIAGGVEWLSGANPDTFREPSTGLSMGEHTETTRQEWEIPRARQDDIALASHRNAIAARDTLAPEIFPLHDVEADTGPRADTSLDALSALRPVFNPDGTLTAGNSSPVTDGASAVLLMSEDRVPKGANPWRSFTPCNTPRLTQTRASSWHRRSQCRRSSQEPGFGSTSSILLRCMKPFRPRFWPTRKRGSRVGRVRPQGPLTGTQSTSTAVLSQSVIRGPPPVAAF